MKKIILLLVLLLGLFPFVRQGHLSVIQVSGVMAQEFGASEYTSGIAVEIVGITTTPAHCGKADGTIIITFKGGNGVLYGVSFLGSLHYCGYPRPNTDGNYTYTFPETYRANTYSSANIISVSDFYDPVGYWNSPVVVPSSYPAFKVDNVVVATSGSNGSVTIKPYDAISPPIGNYALGSPTFTSTLLPTTTSYTGIHTGESVIFNGLSGTTNYTVTVVDSYGCTVLEKEFGVNVNGGGGKYQLFGEPDPDLNPCNPNAALYSPYFCELAICDDQNQYGSYNKYQCEANICDPLNANYDHGACLKEQCIPGNGGYNEQACNEQKAICDKSSLAYNKSKCDDAQCDIHDINYSKPECESEVCDETSKNYSSCGCEQATCDINNTNYVKTECELQVCDETSCNYDKNDCEKEQCNSLNSNYSIYDCELQSCDENSINYSASGCEIATCTIGNANYEQVECEKQACDETSVNYNKSGCEIGTCTPGNANYRKFECELEACEEFSVNYSLSGCEIATCTSGNANYEPFECQLQTCDEGSVNYSESGCEIATCTSGNANYNVQECENQACDKTSVNYSDSRCETATCTKNNVNYSERQCEAQVCDLTSINYNLLNCETETCNPDNYNYDASKCQTLVCNNTITSIYTTCATTPCKDLTVFSVVSTPQTDKNLRNGVIKVTAAGGTPSYSMWISPNYQTTMHIEQQNKVSFTNLASGTYTINLMDTHGCTSTSGGVVNPPPSIQIFSDKAKGSPKEEIKFDFHLTNPSNIKPDYYALEIKMGNKWLDLQDLSTTDMSASFVPKTLGNLTFRLSFSYTDNNNISYEVLSDEINYEVGYCDNEFISDYGTKMNDCWNNMLSATEANKQKNEYGFAVQYKGLSGDISTDDRSNSVDCNTLIITLEGYSIATNPSASIDPRFGSNSTFYTLGVFHVHPSLKYCPSNIISVPGPSDIDKSSPGISYCPHIVRTYSSQISGLEGLKDYNVGHTDTQYGSSCTNY